MNRHKSATISPVRALGASAFDLDLGRFCTVPAVVGRTFAHDLPSQGHSKWSGCSRASTDPKAIYPYTAMG